MGNYNYEMILRDLMFYIKNSKEQDSISQDILLEVKDFYKKYKGSKNYSVKDINLYVCKGEIVGLIGKNGAGKSTIIKSVCGINPFDEGDIIINNISVKSKPSTAKKFIGYVPDDHSVYDKLTGREYANFMGSMFGVKKKDRIERIKYYSEKFNIQNALDKQIASYSHGMKQKICLIGSLIHNPKIWILDEPMVGLDHQTKNDVLNFIKEYAQQGNCVLFSSHDLNTVKKICDKLYIITNGTIASFINLKNTHTDSGFDLEQYFESVTKTGR